MFDLVRHDVHGAAILQQYQLARLLAGAASDASSNSLEACLQEPSLLFANRYAQPLIVAAGMAAWDCLRQDLPPPDLVAGYSVGELTAYGVAGMWTAATALDVARLRAEYMDDCLAAGPPQGLLAISGLSLVRAAPLLAQRCLHIAIQTDSDSCIVGGGRAELLAAQAQFSALGARTSLLPVSIASHTPLMAAAAAPFAALLAAVPWQPVRSLLLAGVSGMPLSTPDAARSALLAQLTTTIDWTACMDACAEQGICVALELGPGAALSRMLQQRHAHIACRSLSDFRTLGGARKWLQSQIE